MCMFFFVNLFVAIQERQIRFWRHMRRATISVKIFDARHGNFVVKDTHRFDKRCFDFGLTDHCDTRQKVMRNGDKRVAGPSRKPVHRTATEQSGKLQSSIAEFFTNLKKNGEQEIFIHQVALVRRQHKDFSVFESRLPPACLVLTSQPLTVEASFSSLSFLTNQPLTVEASFTLTLLTLNN